MPVMSFIISVKMPLRSSPGSLRYFPTFIFSNSSLWELKCPVTLRTSKRHCCNFKDGLNSFFSLPVKENVLFIDTMQKAQHERWDWGGLGRHRGKKVVPSTASRDGGGGGWEGEVEKHVWCIQNKNGHEKLSSPSELRTHVKQANAKKPVVIYWKVTFTCVVPGW